MYSVICNAPICLFMLLYNTCQTCFIVSVEYFRLPAFMIDIDGTTILLNLYFLLLLQNVFGNILFIFTSIHFICFVFIIPFQSPTGYYLYQHATPRCSFPSLYSCTRMEQLIFPICSQTADQTYRTISMMHHQSKQLTGVLLSAPRVKTFCVSPPNINLSCGIESYTLLSN